MSNSYDDWISMFDSEFNDIWIKEEKDLKKLSMVYCAFIKEILSVKNTLDKEIDALKATIKQRDFLKKCQNFKGIVESEQISLTLPPAPPPELDNKENLPLKDLSNVNKRFKSKNILNLSESSSSSDSELTSSPIIFKSRRGWRKSRSSPKSENLLPNNVSKNSVDKKELTQKIPEFKETTCVNSASTSGSVSKYKSNRQIMKLKGAKCLDLNETNCADSSIIEGTPEPVVKAKNLKLSLIEMQKKKKRQRNNTLTQMLSEPVARKKKRIIDTNDPSMNIDEILDIVAESDDDETIITNTNIDLTLDDSDQFFHSRTSKNSRSSLSKKNYDNLDFIQPLSSTTLHNSKLIEDIDTVDVLSNFSAVNNNNSKSSSKKSEAVQAVSSENTKISSSYLRNFNKFPEQKQTSPNEEKVRGKERKKLKGWSCKDCENFYEYLNLSEDELEKKMNECSKHRSKPPQDTFSGFWNMTFRPTQE